MSSTRKIPAIYPVFPPFQHDRTRLASTARSADHAVLVELRRFLGEIRAPYSSIGGYGASRQQVGPLVCLSHLALGPPVSERGTGPLETGPARVARDPMGSRPSAPSAARAVAHGRVARGSFGRCHGE